jgi:hypothetical protein
MDLPILNRPAALGRAHSLFILPGNSCQATIVKSLRDKARLTLPLV